MRIKISQERVFIPYILDQMRPANNTGCSTEKLVCFTLWCLVFDRSMFAVQPFCPRQVAAGGLSSAQLIR